jgi:hypothetical protein
MAEPPGGLQHAGGQSDDEAGDRHHVDLSVDGSG